jgi:L,D-peptidoglycan transpeptidase YkuD (ErfK/YbiS/YcfS/YnhG family)
VILVGPGWLEAFGERIPCAIGRGGFVAAAAKREGDGGTPAAPLPLRGLLLRPDREPAPQTPLPWRWLRPCEGWSDDARDPAYNRPVSHPHGFSAERLWREDGVYDLILVLGWNDRPVVPGRGSAIFWHVAHADFQPTEGCVATPREAIRLLLPRLAPGVELVPSP